MPKPALYYAIRFRYGIESIVAITKQAGESRHARWWGREMSDDGTEILVNTHGCKDDLFGRFDSGKAAAAAMIRVRHAKQATKEMVRWASDVARDVRSGQHDQMVRAAEGRPLLPPPALPPMPAFDAGDT